MREVRLTIVRTISQRLTTPTPWRDCDYDFTGVTFEHHLDLGGAVCRGHMDFSQATFRNHARFLGAMFTGRANFLGVTFTSGADFQGDGTVQGAAKGVCPHGLLAIAQASEGRVRLPRWWTHPGRVRMKNPPPSQEPGDASEPRQEAP